MADTPGYVLFSMQNYVTSLDDVQSRHSNSLGQI